jgi:hypothetical protein
MSIYGQPNSWQCGPFALKHGLLSVGVFAHEEELTRIAASSTEHGTDERQLARTARVFGCELPVVRRGSAGGARDELATHLARGTPVLLCVDNWEHWITAVAMHDDRVVVFDSHYDQPLRVEAWDQLVARLVYRQRRWGGAWMRSVYDLMPLTPTAPGYTLALTAERLEHLLRSDHAELAKRWDEHAAALLELAVPPGRQLEFGFPLVDFLTARRSSIVEAASQRIGYGVGPAAERLVGELIFTATLYQPLLRPDREPEAVERIAHIVAGALPPAPAAEPARAMVA